MLYTHIYKQMSLTYQRLNLLDRTVLGLEMISWSPKEKPSMYSSHIYLILSSMKWHSCILRSIIWERQFDSLHFSKSISFHSFGSPDNIMAYSPHFTDKDMEAQRWNLAAVMKLNIAELGLDPRSVGFHLPCLPSCSAAQPRPQTHTHRWKLKLWLGGFQRLQKKSWWNFWLKQQVDWEPINGCQLFWTHKTHIMCRWFLKLKLNQWCPIIFQHCALE